MIKQLKLKLAKMLSKFAEVTTDKGVLICDGEMVIGKEVFLVDADGEYVSAPDGDYIDGETTYKVTDGVISEIVMPEVEEPEEETEVVETEVEPEVEPVEPEVGPSTIEVISLITSLKSKPSLAIKDGLVVTPQITPKSLALRMSSTFAVSIKKRMVSPLQILSIT